MHAGTQSPVEGSSGFRADNQTGPAPPAQSTPSRASEPPARTLHNPSAGGVDPLPISGNARSGQDLLGASTVVENAAGVPTSAAAGRQERAPVRIRRNAWQTMQEHLANGGKEPRSSKQYREGASAPDLAPSDQSQAADNSASLSREGALHPDARLLPSDDAVPSLLLRLSDPVPAGSTRPQNATATDGGPAARRETLSAPKAGKGISVSEMSVRTRARPAREEDRSAASRLPGRPPPTQHQEPGAAGRDADASAGENRDVGTDDVGAVGHMSSASEEWRGGEGEGGQSLSATPFCHFACEPRKLITPPGAPPDAKPATGRGATRSDPRFLLMQKLELEKRRARAPAVPTAEKTQLSPSGAGAPHAEDAPVPVAMATAVASMSASDGTSDGRTPSALGADVAAAERTAEQRREAALRSQAQLRVRLAAAKRAAMERPATATSTSTGPAETGSGTGFSSRSADESLVSQEMVLKSRLRARKA